MTATILDKDDTFLVKDLRVDSISCGDSGMILNINDFDREAIIQAIRGEINNSL